MLLAGGQGINVNAKAVKEMRRVKQMCAVVQVKHIIRIHAPLDIPVCLGADALAKLMCA